MGRRIKKEKGLWACAASMAGDRKKQQDWVGYELSQGQFLGAVCDGMGGMAAGEKASRTAGETLLKRKELLLSHEGEEEDFISKVPKLLKELLKIMDKEVAALLENRREEGSCGTTAALVYAWENRCFWASVGDSRIYVIRGREIIPATRAHNYGLLLEMLLEKGQITREEYEKSSVKQEVLVSYLGMGAIPLMDISQTPFYFMDGDVFLLCSDGLYKALTDVQISNIVEACQEEFENTAEILLEAAARHGKRPLDNCSVLLLKYTSGKDEKHEA